MTAASAAVVTDGLVSNIVVVDIDAERQTTFALPDASVVVLPDGSPAGIGWTYDGTDFAAPAAPDAPSEPTDTTPDTPAEEGN